MTTGGDNIQGDKVGGNKVEVGPISVSQNVTIAGGNVFQRINNFFAGDTEAQRAQRNRQNMLQLVWNTWIEGMLKKSLHSELLIELGMETKPDAVEHPWDMVMQMPDREPEMVAPETTMLELFDQANGSLLILGEPGAGKTTMLLELARLAILQAQEDPLQPIPVILNLSAWEPGQKTGGRKEKSLEKTFAGWLVDELRGKYYVSPKISQPWVEKGELLLLLDGLDEVKAGHREACVQAINVFQAEHSMPLVVCCRRQEYEGLAAHLNLWGAIMIRALSEVQVDEYLQRAGPELAAVRQTLKGDSDLCEFAQTPLILSIMVLAYQNATAINLNELETTTDYRKHLFGSYINQMFNRRGVDTRYTIQQARTWLVWLARSMMNHEQSIFYVEDILPDRLTFSNKMLRFFFGLMCGLVLGVFFGLLCGLIVGLVVGVSISVIGWLTNMPKDELRYWLSVELIAGPVVGLIAGLSGALTGGLVAGSLFNSPNLKPIERLSWSWQGIRSGFRARLVYGLAAGLIFGLVYGMITNLGEGLVFGIIIGLIVGSIVGLSGVLSGSSIENRSAPGEGIKTSLHNAWAVGLSGGLIIGLIFGLITDLSGGLLVGSIFVPIFWIVYGGGFFFVHLVSHWLLYRSGHLPRNLIPFLDYCTERIFLRKVGGGYIFVHRMLMEHFAAMVEE